MATISDILKKPDDTAATSVVVVFRTIAGPWARTDAITSAGRISVTTHATTGAFSTTLRQGTYRVEWRIGAEWSSILIYVPSGSATYDFNAIAINTDEGSTGQNVFDNWADIQAFEVDASVDVVLLRQDEGGARDIFFVRSTHANVLAFTPDGVNVIDDALDARFLRQGVDPSDL